MTENNIFTKFDAPPSYPKELLETSNNRLNCKTIYFTQLSDSITTSTEKMLAGEWPSNNVIAFCGYNGINTVGSKEIITRVSNILTYENINDKSQRGQEIIIEDKKSNPSRYVKWEGGSFWKSGLLISQFVDSIMHFYF